MKRIAVVLGVVFSLVSAGIAQRAARTVTNTDLAKHREKRLNAERDYRDNYAQMGFPSPEELEQRRERDMAERLELAEQLRQARLEEERLEIERSRVAIEAERLDLEREASQAQYAYPPYFGYGGFGYGGFGFSGFHGRHRPGFFPPGFLYPPNRLLPVFSIPTYRATPAGVIQYNQSITPRFFPVRPGPIFGAPSRGGIRLSTGIRR